MPFANILNSKTMVGFGGHTKHELTECIPTTKVGIVYWKIKFKKKINPSLCPNFEKNLDENLGINL